MIDFFALATTAERLCGGDRRLDIFQTITQRIQRHKLRPRRILDDIFDDSLFDIWLKPTQFGGRVNHRVPQQRVLRLQRDAPPRVFIETAQPPPAPQRAKMGLTSAENASRCRLNLRAPRGFTIQQPKELVGCGGTSWRAHSKNP